MIPAETYTPTEHRYTCDYCKRLCVAFAETIRAFRVQSDYANNTDAEVAADINICLECVCGAIVPGEHVGVTPPAGKRYPITSAESQAYIELGEWPDEDGGCHDACEAPVVAETIKLTPAKYYSVLSWMGDVFEIGGVAANGRPTNVPPHNESRYPSLYARRIKEILNNGGMMYSDVRHVEAYMRLEHSTLDGLDAHQFGGEVLVAVQCIVQGGIPAAEELAQSFGL